MAVDKKSRFCCKGGAGSADGTELSCFSCRVEVFYPSELTCFVPSELSYFSPAELSCLSPVELSCFVHAAEYSCFPPDESSCFSPAMVLIFELRGRVELFSPTACDVPPLGNTSLEVSACARGVGLT
ncbi:hypothetical protein TNCV_2904661 [Trichonephila clavipes]|nr:hypothetical protein TNCV_2904661 [Trichonephila clavipes]